jgi:PelA/Pel-15E family pectate lyase
MRRYFMPLRALFLVSLFGVAFAADKPRPWPPDQFLPLTPERIAALPAAEQPAWRAYFAAQLALAEKIPARKAPEFSPLIPINGPPIGGKHSRGLRLGGTKEWFASDEARTIADRVVERQSAAGAWPKGNDYTKPTPPAETGAHDVWSGGTLDNDATTWELRFLALANAAAAEPARSAAWREAFLRGVRYLFAAQYPNGGFPQIYPLVGGYHDAITFNDDAMVQALELLRDIGDGKPEFDFVPAELRAECAPRVARGVACILATQLRDAQGARTVWCQQHDALTLKPCAARNFEPVAACTNESASLVRFLMSLPQPSADVRAAITGAVAWFRRVAQPGVAWSRADGVGALVARPGAAPLWARMYELGTDKPIFGDRDRTIHYDVAELSTERRAGYAWYGAWPAAALAEFPAWQAQHAK